ncbi:class I SAM-dependent methyltransferase [Undibacterium fentianense]|uniref:Uncharacterized protein n=1 Tax=Undibacterium fentianense TaxID=2828728 RepID=A0A941IE40_9BURK|nr:class I SAM-dependent methyltransferase [Undibacterium fentianense]MBR7800673.1 hypothetical protein [Undibacterium fentianense]
MDTTPSQAFLNLLTQISQQTPYEQINAIVDFSNQLTDEQCMQLLGNDAEVMHHSPRLTQVYYDYIIQMETVEIQRLLADTGTLYTSFRETASPAAMMAYDRVADIFDNLELNGKTVVMVGCGQLPVTAIHLCEESQIKKVYALDISAQAIDVVHQLQAKFGWSNLEAQFCNGNSYDYSEADIVYIANMVRPKAEVIAQVLKTARADAEIIIREPYALGKLWADCAEDTLDARLSVRSYGPGSRYLSRDAFIQR